MIDDAQVEPLAHALESDPDPRNQRLLLEALTHLALSPAAWRAASWLARSALRDLGDPDQADPAVLELAARLPLRSVRDRLRHLASDPELPGALPSALALAEVGDPAGAVTLAEGVARPPHAESPSPPEAGTRLPPRADLARALARLPLEDGVLEPEAIRPALRSDEEGGDGLTRMWGALALARLGDREPLEELWDALVRPPGFLESLTRRPLFTSPPELFHGAPGFIVRELAGVRPLPERVVDFLRALRRQDYDENWTPRNPALVGDPRDARILLQGLTREAGEAGEAGVPLTEEASEPLTGEAGGPLMEEAGGPEGQEPGGRGHRAALLARRLIQRPWRDLHPDAEPLELTLLRATPPELAAQVLESAIIKLPLPEREDMVNVGAVGEMSGGEPTEAEERPPADGGWARMEAGNALVALAAHLPSGIPLAVARMLENPTLQQLPREQVAWLVARAGPQGVMEALFPRILVGGGEERTRWLAWFGEIARQTDAPPPFLGDDGGAPGPPPPVELVDDLPEEMMVGAPPPAPVRAPAPDPPSAVLELFPDIKTDTPHPLAGDPLVLTVSLGLEAAESTRGSVAIPDTEAPVVLRAHLLMGEQSAWGELTWVTGQGTVEPAVFHLSAPGLEVDPAVGDPASGNPALGDRALVEVRVNFYLGQRWCGEASRNLDV
ncbi:MAG: hypothetical protein EA421_04610, partial [Gemmatimonadales bacterium]